MADWCIYNEDGEEVDGPYTSKKLATEVMETDYLPDEGMTVKRAPTNPMDRGRGLKEKEKQGEEVPPDQVTPSMIKNGADLHPLVSRFIDLLEANRTVAPVKVVRGYEMVANEILEQGRRLDSKWLR